MTMWVASAAGAGGEGERAEGLQNAYLRRCSGLSFPPDALMHLSRFV